MILELKLHWKDQDGNRYYYQFGETIKKLSRTNVISYLYIDKWRIDILKCKKELIELIHEQLSTKVLAEVTDKEYKNVHDSDRKRN